MGCQNGAAGIAGKIDHTPGAVGGHGGYDGIHGVEYCGSFRCHVLNDHALDDCQIFNRADVVQAKVIAHADVGDHSDIAAIETQAFSQDSAASRFKNRCINVWVHQHIASASWAAAIAGVNALVANVDTVGVCHADGESCARNKVSDQASGGGLAVGAGNGRYGYTAGFTRFEHGFNNGFADRARFAEGRAQVHAQAGSRIDFNDAAVLRCQGIEDIFADQINAADIQPYHLRCSNGHFCELGVHLVGNVGGGTAGAQVGVIAQNDERAIFRNRIKCVALPLQCRTRNFIVAADFCQRCAMTIAAGGVSVHDRDQFGDRVRTVTNDVRRIATRCSYQFVADNQQTKIVAGEIALDDHVARNGLGKVECFGDFLRVAQVNRHAFTLVPITGFDDDRGIDFASNFKSFLKRCNCAAHRHGNACGIEQALGQLFVLGNCLCNGTGIVCFSCLNAALAATPAKLNYAALGQATIGNAPLNSCLHDGACAGTQAHIFVQLAQSAECGGQVECLIGSRRATQLLGELKSQLADLLFAVFHHCLIDAVFQCG